MGWPTGTPLSGSRECDAVSMDPLAASIESPVKLKPA